MIKAQTDISRAPRADEGPVLIALTPSGVGMVGPMGRRMMISGRLVWGTKDGPITTTTTTERTP